MATWKFEFATKDAELKMNRKKETFLQPFYLHLKQGLKSKKGEV